MKNSRKLDLLCLNGLSCTIRYQRLLLALLWLVAAAFPARATITVWDYWRMGESDSGATNGGTAVTAISTGGGNDLTFSGQATYSTNVAPTASAHTASTLSVNFTNSAFASNSVIATLVDNFGIEAWVKPASAGVTSILVYNGNTGSSGWGIMINAGSFQGLFGGVAYLGSGIATPNVWTHVALVRNNGVTMLYTNGVPAGATSTSTPVVPTTGFAVAASPGTPGFQSFNGLVDEVRFFNFAAGQFSPSDLLYYGKPSAALGTSSLLVGPAQGSNSVVLAVNPSTSTWTAKTNASWLHLSTGFQSGTGSTNVIFSYDANTGATRSGTLTIDGQLLTVTQAGSTYVAAGSLTTAVSAGVYLPYGLAADGAGNVFFVNNGSAVKEWTPTNNTVTTLVSYPNDYGVAVDLLDNVYVSSNEPGAFPGLVTRGSAAGGGFSAVVTSGLTDPTGMAVDPQGNLFIADTGDNAIKEWPTYGGSLINLGISGLGAPQSVAADAADNVYIADTTNNVLKKWSSASGAVTTVVSGLNKPYGVAVDGSGNIYIADSYNGLVKKWTATSGAVTTLTSESQVSEPVAVAVDPAGNLYIADNGNQQIDELSYVFVDTTGRSESASAGSDTLSAVLPTTANLTDSFAPVSDSSWLTITGVTNGVISFSFTANSFSYAPSRTAHITVLGHSIAVTQGRVPYQIVGTTNLLVGAATGTNSVALEVVPATAAWTATTNATWLHLNAANQSGSGCANVVFTYDANSGVTRSGTLTIAGYTVTVTQAGSIYQAARPLTTLVTNLNGPQGVAVDGSGNVYIADTGNNAVKEWSRTNNSVTTLVSSGLSRPNGLAVDGSGNVYIADNGNSAVKKWSVASKAMTLVASNGSTPQSLSSPEAVAVDVAGNIYIADFGNNSIEKWWAANSNVTAVVSGTANQADGVAVDVAADNVYFSDAGDYYVNKWSAASGTVTPIVYSAVNQPTSVAADGSGNLYIPNINFSDGTSPIEEWSAASGAVATLDSTANNAQGVAVDGSGNVYIADTGNRSIEELPYAFVDSTGRSENANAGSDTLAVVLPTTVNLTGPFAPVSDSSWLTVTGATNGVVSFSFTANYAPLAPSRTGHITVLGKSIAVTQAQAPIVGVTNLLVGPTAGSNSVALDMTPLTSAWTASTNATWLHLSAAYQSGIGCTNVVFTYDANPGTTRSGTLTIAGQTVTVTQAGSTYVAARRLTTLVSSGLSYPQGLAVDGAGNVYIADTSDNAVKEWIAASNSVVALVSSGLSRPNGLAVDGAGNVYIADMGNSAVKKWLATNNTVTTLASNTSSPAQVGSPYAVALDLMGDVYIADGYYNSIEKWSATSSNLTTAVSGATNAIGVAVDLEADNIYFTDGGNFLIKKWSAASGAATTVVSGLNYPEGMTADGSGDLYIANSASGNIQEWSAASGVLTTLVSGLNTPADVKVDAAGNVYLVDYMNQDIMELPYAFVDPTSRSEGAGASSDALPVVLPATENLTGSFAPVSDSTWLIISGVTNGVVHFSFAANSALLAPSRTGHITVLGQSIAVTQAAAPYQLVGTTNLLVGPATGTNSVALDVFPFTSVWTASANATWLHLSAAFQSGTGCTNVIFTYDANAGATRSGTLTIAGKTVTVTQAGATYVSARPLTTLVSSGLYYPNGLAVDGAGNVYIADSDHNAVKEWVAASNSVITLIASGLSNPGDMTVDAAGNLYIADGAVLKWVAASNTLTTVASSSSTPVAVSSAYGVTLDVLGNIYIADGAANRIDKWSVANSNVTVAASADSPLSVAIDPAADNIYFADYNGSSIDRWSAASGTTNAFVPGLNYPQGVATDGSGNLYIAEAAGGDITMWSAASGTTSRLISGLNTPFDVKVDAVGNVYLVDYDNFDILELPYAFVNPAPLSEGAGAGSGALPVVLPATENLTGPFAPASDSPWLTINGATNGVVSFSFTANPSVNGSSRTAHITLLGQSIPITQGAATYTLSTNALWETFAAGSDSVNLTVSPSNAIWTATTNALWLHLTPANQQGIGSATVTFSFDVNTSITPRTNTLTIAGQTLVITQLATPATSPNLTGVELNGSGNFQFSFTNNSSATFSVWSSTNLMLPFTNWILAGAATNMGGGVFQWASPSATSGVPNFFRVTSP